MESFIVSYARTPIGSFQGSLSSLTAVELGSIAIRETLRRSGNYINDVEEVIFGNVLSAGLGQAPARQASILAGLPNSVECTTINKVCGSGMKSIMLADQAIRCGDANFIISGGMESMSNAPYYLKETRNGMRLGHKKVIDSLVYDGLWDPYDNLHMGSCAEVLSKEAKITRGEQDNFALESYKRALDAINNGDYKDEIVPVSVPEKKGKTSLVSIDEEPGRGKPEKISKLHPAFEENGTITVANASGINDGAASIAIMSKKKVEDLNISPIGKIIAQTSVAHAPIYFTTAPSKAISKLLNKAGLTIEDIDIFEINEAFSNVPLITMKEHNISHEKVNIFGGAVSLGHPIGASGTRIVISLITALKKRNKKIGLATICIGGGEAAALIIEV